MRKQSPEFSEDVERSAQYRRQLGESAPDAKPRWVRVPCSTPECSGTSVIHEQDIDNPNISRECGPCWCR